MDALLVAPLFALIILVLIGLTATLGVDSRDGFTDDRHRQAYR